MVLVLNQNLFILTLKLEQLMREKKIGNNNLYVKVFSCFDS